MTDQASDLTGPPETFDLIGAIEGTTYPEADVRFLFDAKAANALAALDSELKKNLALGRTDEYNAIEPVFFDAIENLKAATFTVTVRSTPRKVRKAVLAEADAKYPVQRNALTGVEEPNFEKQEFLNVLTWRAHIVKFTDPGGKVVQGPLDRALVEKLLDEAPDASIAAVSEKIDELQNGAAAGYGMAVRNLDFSSERSPEGSPGDTLPQSE